MFGVCYSLCVVCGMLVCGVACRYLLCVVHVCAALFDGCFVSEA